MCKIYCPTWEGMIKLILFSSSLPKPQAGVADAADAASRRLQPRLLNLNCVSRCCMTSRKSVAIV